MPLPPLSWQYLLSGSKCQIPYDFTHMWNLKNKTNDHRGKKRGKLRNRLNYREQTDGDQR